VFFSLKKQIKMRIISGLPNSAQGYLAGTAGPPVLGQVTHLEHLLTASTHRMEIHLQPYLDIGEDTNVTTFLLLSSASSPPIYTQKQEVDMGPR
jgi:hypothetical protein